MQTLSSASTNPVLNYNNALQPCQAGVLQPNDTGRSNSNFKGVSMPLPNFSAFPHLPRLPGLNLPVHVVDVLKSAGAEAPEVVDRWLSQRRSVKAVEQNCLAGEVAGQLKKIAVAEKRSEVPKKLQDSIKVERIVQELCTTLADLKASLSANKANAPASQKQLSYCNQAEVLLENLAKEIKERARCLAHWVNSCIVASVSNSPEKAFSENSEDLKLSFVPCKMEQCPKELDLNRYKAQVDRMKEMLSESAKPKVVQKEPVEASSTAREAICESKQSEDDIKKDFEKLKQANGIQPKEVKYPLTDFTYAESVDKIKEALSSRCLKFLEDHAISIQKCENKMNDCISKIMKVQRLINKPRSGNNAIREELVNSYKNQEKNMGFLIKCLQDKEDSMRTLFACMQQKEELIRELIQQLRAKDAELLRCMRDHGEVSSKPQECNPLVKLKELPNEKTELKAKEEELKELVVELKKKEDMISELKERDKTLKELLEQLFSDILQRKGEIEKSKSIIQEKEDNIKELDEARKGKELTILELVSSLHKQDAKIKDLNKQIQTGEEILSQLKEKNENIDELLNDLSDDLQVKDGNLLELKDELQSNEIRLRELTEELEEKKRKVQELSIHSQTNTEHSFNSPKEIPPAELANNAELKRTDNLVLKGHINGISSVNSNRG